MKPVVHIFGERAVVRQGNLQLNGAFLMMTWDNSLDKGDCTNDKALLSRKPV